MSSRCAYSRLHATIFSAPALPIQQQHELHPEVSNSAPARGRDRCSGSHFRQQRRLQLRAHTLSCHADTDCPGARLDLKFHD